MPGLREFLGRSAGDPGDGLIGNVGQRRSAALDGRPLGPSRIVRTDRQPRRLRVDLSADAGGMGELALQCLIPRVTRGVVAELRFVVAHGLAEGGVDGREALTHPQLGVGQGRAALTEQ